MLNSTSNFVTGVEFPVFSGIQHYMLHTTGERVEFPEGLEDYERQVQNLCDSLGYKGDIHVTIDEKRLEAGQTQRKPHPHVDGRFRAGYWGHGGGGGWNHYCNELPIPRMAVAVASNVARCKVFHGQFDAEPNHQGDLSHIKHLLGDGELVPANEWHLLSPDCVHESLPAEQACERSFIRVAFETNPIQGV